MFGIAVTLQWWRVGVPVAFALLIAWGISKVAENSVRLSYALLLVGLVGGAGWHLRAIRTIQSRNNGSLSGVSEANVP